MKFDPQTVAQAKAFVNALRAGKRARVTEEEMQMFVRKTTAQGGGGPELQSKGCEPLIKKSERRNEA